MTIEEKFERYPYAFAHNPWTGEICKDENGKPWPEDLNLPFGWRELFWQCMEDIRQPLIDANLLDEFYFTQVKEKYATMRLYCNKATHDIFEILNNYEYLSEFICEKCGAPATKQSYVWITSLCDECAKECAGETTDLIFNPIMEIEVYPIGEEKKTISKDLSDIVNRLYKKE